MHQHNPNAKQAVALVGILALVLVFVTIADPAPTAPPCEDEKQCPYPEQPPVAPPVSERTWNYAGGSCMHASLITLLRWQGREKAADYWRSNYYGSAGVHKLAGIAERLNLDYAITNNGSTRFMQWASDTGRGAAIHWHRGIPNWRSPRIGGHAVTFCGYFNGNALLIDNNSPRKYIRISKQQFIQEWRSYGGYAMTVVYDRPAPKPWS